MKPMRPALPAIARATLLEARRSRFFWVVAAMALLAFGLSLFIRQLALIEGREIQAAIIAALARAGSVFLVCLFTVMSMAREFNDKVVELLLAQPISRTQYALGKLSGFSIVAVLAGLAVALPLLPLSDGWAWCAWALSLCLELVIVTAFAFFCVVALEQALGSIVAVLGFYLLARSMDAIRIMASSNDETLGGRLSAGLLQGIDALMPPLSGMTQTAWLLESPPTPSAIAFICAQAAIYILLLSAATVFDFHRKNF